MREEELVVLCVCVGGWGWGGGGVDKYGKTRRRPGQTPFTEVENAGLWWRVGPNQTGPVSAFVLPAAVSFHICLSPTGQSVCPAPGFLFFFFYINLPETDSASILC